MLNLSFDFIEDMVVKIYKFKCNISMKNAAIVNRRIYFRYI